MLRGRSKQTRVFLRSACEIVNLVGGEESLLEGERFRKRSVWMGNGAPVVPAAPPGQF